MNLLDLLTLNLNYVTIAGIIIGIFILLYIVFRISTGFINPFNIIDRLILVIAIITIIMVWGYSIIENILYTLLGQVIFFGSLVIVLAYFLLFYNNKPKKKSSSSKNKKSSSYSKIVFGK